MGQVQVITGLERRRRWSDEQKRAIVAAALAPGAVVSEVARRADVCANQIYRWRRGFARMHPVNTAGSGLYRASGSPVCGGVLLVPIPRQQLVEPVRRMFGDAGEDIVSLR